LKDFVFLNKKDFAGKKIFPIVLKKAVIGWLKNKKYFGHKINVL